MSKVVHHLAGGAWLNLQIKGWTLCLGSKVHMGQRTWNPHLDLNDSLPLLTAGGGRGHWQDDEEEEEEGAGRYIYCDATLVYAAESP